MAFIMGAYYTENERNVVRCVYSTREMKLPKADCYTEVERKMEKCVYSTGKMKLPVAGCNT